MVEKPSELADSTHRQEENLGDGENLIGNDARILVSISSESQLDSFSDFVLDLKSREATQNYFDLKIDLELFAH